MTKNAGEKGGGKKKMHPCHEGHVGKAQRKRINVEQEEQK